MHKVQKNLISKIEGKYRYHYDAKQLIINADTFEIIKLLEDNIFDLILTDPPYGDNFGYGRKNKTILNNESVDVNFKFIDSVYRLLKDNKSMYIFSNWKYEIDIRNYIKDNTEFNERHKIVLNKNNIGMGYGFRNKYEELLVFEKGKAKYNLNDFANVINMPHINLTENDHQHKKHPAVLRKILLHSTQKNDLVFDGFAGSFQTAISCYKEDRYSITTELDSKWFEPAIKEFTKDTMQKELF